MHTIPQPPVPTVRIASDDTEQGFLIVNASDFDAATMTLFGAEAPADAPAAAKKKA
jgi:hypothetical protein